MIIQLNNPGALVGERTGPAWAYIGDVDTVTDAGTVEYGAWWYTDTNSPWSTRDVHAYGYIPQDGDQTAFGDMHVVTKMDGSQVWLWVNTDQVYLCDDRGTTIARLRCGDAIVRDKRTHAEVVQTRPVLTRPVDDGEPEPDVVERVRTNLLWQTPTQAASGMGFTGRLTYEQGRPVY